LWHAWEKEVYRVLVEKPEEKRPLGRPRHRLKDGIRMALREIGCGIVDWLQLAHDRERWWALVNTVTNLRVLVPQSELVTVHYSVRVHISTFINSVLYV
jgi:hypothetical protein